MCAFVFSAGVTLRFLLEEFFLSSVASYTLNLKHFPFSAICWLHNFFFFLISCLMFRLFCLPSMCTELKLLSSPAAHSDQQSDHLKKMNSYFFIFTLPLQLADRLQPHRITPCILCGHLV